MFHKEDESPKQTDSKEDWTKPVDVTKQCQDMYDLPESEKLLIGGSKFPGAAYNNGVKDYGQSLRDWQRAVNVTPDQEEKEKAAAQLIFIVVDDKKIHLNELLSELYKVDKNIKRYTLFLNNQNNVSFASTAGLTNFYADYLFAKVEDEKKKIELANHSLLHLHQSGLPYALGFNINKNCLQTSDDKFFVSPSVWIETYQPLKNGVSITAEHRFTRMMMNGEPLDLKLEEGIHAECKASITMNPGQSKDVIKNNIDEAKFSLHHESVRDYIFDVGFVKNNSEKQKLIKKLYEKLNEVSKDHKEFNRFSEEKKKIELEKGHVAAKKKVGVLSEVIVKFKLVDLSNPEELAEFQRFLARKAEGLNRTPQSSPSYLSDLQARVSGLGLMKILKPTTTAVLEELSGFISKQQEKLKLKS